LFAFYLDDIVNDIDFGQGSVEKADNYHSNQDNVVNLVITDTHLKTFGRNLIKINIILIIIIISLL